MSKERDDRARPPARPTNAARPPGGLCPACVHVKTITSAKGSIFYLCARSKDDPRWPKYPPQPVVACAGFER